MVRKIVRMVVSFVQMVEVQYAGFHNALVSNDYFQAMILENF